MVEYLYPYEVRIEIKDGVRKCYRRTPKELEEYFKSKRNGTAWINSNKTIKLLNELKEKLTDPKLRGMVTAMKEMQERIMKDFSVD